MTLIFFTSQSLQFYNSFTFYNQIWIRFNEQFSLVYIIKIISQLIIIERYRFPMQTYGEILNTEFKYIQPCIHVI